MRTTQQVRDLYEPHCVDHLHILVPAYEALNLILKKYGYRPRQGVTGSFNCRPITGGTRYSLHAYKGGDTFVFWTLVAVTIAVAVDINWDKNPYGPNLVTDMPRAMVDEICALRTIDGLQIWRWGGYYSGNKDAMHFEIVVSPAELARGIANFPSGTSDEEEPWMGLTATGMARFKHLFEDDDLWQRFNSLLQKVDEDNVMIDEWPVIRDLVNQIAGAVTAAGNTGGGPSGPSLTAEQVKEVVRDLLKNGVG